MDLQIDGSLQVSGSGDKTNQNCAMALQMRACFLHQVLPSSITHEQMLDMEAFLNQLYLEAYAENWPVDMQQAVLHAFSRWSTLLAQRRNKPPATNAQFIVFLKNLANFFSIIAYYLNSETSRVLRNEGE